MIFDDPNIKECIIVRNVSKCTLETITIILNNLQFDPPVWKSNTETDRDPDG